MINSINSYSNYNYYTNTLNSNKKNSKTNDLVDNNKEINNNTNLNNNNNISNNTSLKQTNSNLVSDKSKAVNKILGYGVDEDGFFTSDFNEAAGIPKDYKIYAKDMESFVNFQENDNFIFSTHYKIDIAKTIGNAYKAFSQLIPQTSNSSFSQEELKNLPYGFSMDKNYNITKIYTKDEYEKIDFSQDTIYASFNTWNGSYFEDINTDNIFSNNGDTRLNKNAYINEDGSIDKGGVLMGFLNSQLYGATTNFLEGDTKLLGKILVDKNVSEAERNDFQNFMNKNKIQSAFYKDSSNPDEWNPFEERLSIQLYIKRSQNVGNTELAQQARDFAKEYNELINSNISLNEFKTKYLDFKERYDGFIENLEAEEKAKGIDYSIDIASGQSISNNKNKKTQDDNTQKSFKPIQAESKNKETYKDDNIRNELIKKLLENKFDLAKELEILFNVKIDNDNTNNNSNSNDNSNDNNSNSNHLNKLNSKAKHRSVNIKV
ncbi:Cj0814 family flagellar-dependent secreted protein [Campylobacter molothri]|uniref:Cj0814 family flagellar-dependent secreted protein n=1 Tax=Campylobacter molothri TaxID=1032242 RepID=UPI00301C47E9